MNTLPGHHPGHFAVESDIHLTFIASSVTVGSDQLTYPAAILAGDLLVMLVLGSSINSDPPSVNVGPGFTELSTASANPGGNSAVRYTFGYKIADGTEDGIVDDLGSPGSQVSGAILQFRPSRPITSATLVDSDFEASSFNPSAITTGAGLDYNLYVGGWIGRPDPIDTPTISITADGSLTDIASSGAEMRYDWKVFNPDNISVDVTIDMADSGSANVLVGFAILLA